MKTRKRSQVLVEPVAFFEDSRGLVLEPIPADLIPPQRNVHVVLTAPGAVRGNHCHKEGTEIFVLVGPALVRLREAGAIHDVCVPAGRACRFTIPPGTAHAIQNTGSRPLLLIVFNTRPFSPDGADTVPEVLI